MVQENYNANGWLGVLMGTTVWHGMWHTDLVDAKFANMFDDVEKFFKSAPKILRPKLTAMNSQSNLGASPKAGESAEKDVMNGLIKRMDEMGKKNDMLEAQMKEMQKKMKEMEAKLVSLGG